MPSPNKKRDAKNEDPMIHPCHKESNAVGLDKPVGNNKHMNAKKAMDSYGNGERTRLKHNLFVPNKYRGGGPWVRGKKGCGLVVGRRGSLFWGSHLSSFGRKSCWDDIPPKRGKHEL